MLPRLVVLFAALALLAPVATAFSTPRDEVAIAYDANRAPLVLAAGDLSTEGVFRVGLLGALLTDARVGPIPRLVVAESTGTGIPQMDEVTDATVVIHNGSLLWMLGDAAVGMRATAPYAFGLALPKSPFDEQGAPASPALIVAGPEVRADLEWSGAAPADLIPLDAIVSVLDASGAPVAGYDRRHVNGDLDASTADGSGRGVVLRAEGAFAATLLGQALAGGLGGAAADLDLDVQRAEDERFLETVAALDGAMSSFSGGEATGLSGPESPVAQLVAISGFLNGAVVLLPPPGGEGETPDPREARIGGRDVDTGPFTVLRSEDLALAWGDEQMSVRGTPTVAITSQGIHSEAPLTLGPVPLLSLLLWLGAVGAVVYYFMRRPPKAEGKTSLRLMSTVVYGLALLLVFILWDVSFAETFGTSVLTLLREKGFSPEAYSQFAMVFGLEMIPWTLAALLFALPVRIALGVLLRYRGQGSSYKGVAKAGGLVALAIFGPIYALWIVNVLVQQLLKMAPQMFG